MGTNEVESGFKVPGVCIAFFFTDREVPGVCVTAQLSAVVFKAFQVENVLTIQRTSLNLMYQLGFTQALL